LDGSQVLMPALGILKGVVLTIVAFGLMVFIHELGHFLAAKLMRVRVERFSFGMPPKIWGRKWGDTEYLISALPIGGYVKLAGGDEGQEATGAPDEFVSKTPSQRAVILAAGPLFSVLFGIPLAIGMLVLGHERYLATVSEVVVGSGAWEAGLEYGDRITSLGGRPIGTFDRLKQAAAEMPTDRPVPMTLERGGQPLTRELTREAGQPSGMAFEPGACRVAQLSPGSPADRAGIRPGDLIVTLRKRLVGSPEDFEQRLARAPAGQPLAVLIERGGHAVSLPVSRRRGQRLGIECYLNTLRINRVHRDSPAEQAGLKPGDVVRTIDGMPLRGWADFRRHILERPGRPTELGIERDGKAMTLEATPKENLEGDPGFTVRLPQEVGFVRPGFPAEGRLNVEDRIVAVNGRPVAGWLDIEDAVAAGPPELSLKIEHKGQPQTLPLTRGPGSRVADTLGIAPRPTYLIASVQWQTEPPVQVGDEITYIGRQEVAETINSGAVYTPPDDVLNYIAHEKKVTVRRDGTQFKVQVTPEQRARGQLGIEPTAVAGIHQETFLGSLRPAVEQTLSIGTFAFVVIWKLITGDVSLADLMGPVGIVQQTYLSVERGYSHLFWLIHLITVNIGVFNLIPIPPLDGGRIAMLVYEKLRGRQPSRRFQEAIMLAGLALVLLIFVVATFNDVRRLIFS